MDIYLATGFALSVVVVCAVSRLQSTRYLFLIAAALALNGCLSLRLGSNDKAPATVGQSAGPVGRSAGTLDVANSMAEAPGGS
jgi:hypothetical protein